MSDRRSRPIVRCAIPECVSVGAWQSSRGLCPVHYNLAVEHARAAIARHRNPEPDPAPSGEGWLQAATQTPPRPARRNPPMKEG